MGKLVIGKEVGTKACRKRGGKAKEVALKRVEPD